jgi:DNA-binding response OmpR family regulator
MNILVVEDEPLVADFLLRGLSAEGHVVQVASDGAEGQGYALAGGFDIILLDVMLPGRSGLEVCEALRGAGVATPILMVTALDAVPDRVEGLRRGADDYVVKPYAFDELLARIDALFRRSARPSRPEEIRHFVCGDLEFDRETLEIRRGGAKLDLTAKEIGILELLMARPGSVISRERILNSVWGVHADPLTNVVDVYIGRLRRKLQAHGPPMIETVRGFGYRLDSEHSAEPDRGTRLS